MRFTDWNSLLGTTIFALIALAVSTGAYFSPETFSQDSRIIAKLIPYLGPIVAIAALYRLVIYVDLGPTIVFRRIFGRREYDWKQLKGVETRAITKKYFFGLVEFTHEFLIFSLLDRGKHHHHVYRVAEGKKKALKGILQAHLIK